MIDAITTNETLFFRDTAPFDLLRNKIVPELIDRRARTGTARIRIWSAACSTGQEIYSIAILLKELLGDPERYGVRLMGTDISDDAVSRASRGIYNEAEISRGLSDQFRDKYFVRSPKGWQIRDEIRAMASFKHLNLMGDLSPHGQVRSHLLPQCCDLFHRPRPDLAVPAPGKGHGARWLPRGGVNGIAEYDLPAV